MLSTTELHITRLKATTGVPVTFRSDSVIAVPTVSTARMLGSGGTWIIQPVDDWVILLADLTNDTPPEQGAIIELEDGSIYIVNHPDPNTPHYENFNQLDRPAKAWTIHTYKLKT